MGKGWWFDGTEAEWVDLQFRQLQYEREREEKWLQYLHESRAAGDAWALKELLNRENEKHLRWIGKHHGPQSSQANLQLSIEAFLWFRVPTWDDLRAQFPHCRPKHLREALKYGIEHGLWHCKNGRYVSGKVSTDP